MYTNISHKKSLLFYISLKKRKGIDQSVFCKTYPPNTAWSGVFELTIEVWHVKNPKKIPQPALQSKKTSLAQLAHLSRFV